MPPKTPKRGRPKNSPGAQAAARQVRRQKLAAAIIEGKPISGVAKEANLSRSWASQEANAPETKAILSAMVDEHASAIKALIPKALQAIDDCIGPTCTLKLPGQKKAVTLPNEPRVRLLATKRVIELALAGRKGEEKTGGDTTITWQQFQTIYFEKRGATTP